MNPKKKPSVKVAENAAGTDKSWKMELACCTSTLLAEISRPEAKRLDVAKTYALALRSSENTDWGAVNRAIMERWSIAALEWIKQKAWSGRAFDALPTRPLSAEKRGRRA